MQLYADHLSLSSDLKVVEELVKRLEKAGLALASLEIAPFSYLFTDPKPEVRKEAECTVRRALEIASVTGMPGVLVIPGYVGLP